MGKLKEKLRSKENKKAGVKTKRTERKIWQKLLYKYSFTIQ